MELENSSDRELVEILVDGLGGYVNNDPDLEGYEIISVKRGFTEIEPLYNLLSPFNAFICGGYVRYMGSPRHKPFPAGDVDIYCNDKDVFTDVYRELRNNGLRHKHENDVSITFSIPNDGIFKYSPTIQLIKPVIEGSIVSVGSMETILNNFDFSVVRCGLVSRTEIKADRNFLEDERKGSLRLKNIHCPISSTLRCMKYSKKGYWLKPMEAVKLFLDWEGRSEDYRKTIIEYLQKANNGNGLSQEEIEEMESLMRID